MSITSYAQNFEDVMLWRALGSVENGFYIDVGAQHPIIDSVSRAFYERGWSGIHVEPTATYSTLLRQDRPDETVLQAALAKTHGTLTFYEIPETGLSTADAAIAERHKQQGFEVREATVPCLTLADVFERAGTREIHWLKIDVEGFERQVLEGWGQSPARPWVVAVESTLPLTTIETHTDWEPLLLAYGYEPVYFDGLNRYYVSTTHSELREVFRAGPNVFDGFVLNGTASAPFCRLVQERHKTELGQAQHTAQQEINRLTEALANQQALLAQQEQALSEQLCAANESARQLETGLLDQSRASLEKEQALVRDYTNRVESLLQQLQAVQTEQQQQTQEGAARERVLAQQTAQARHELENLLRTLAQRENEFSRELLQSRHEAEQATAAQTLAHVERERELTQQALQARQEVEALLRSHAQRESEFSRDLLQLRHEAEQATAAQTLAHVARERELTQQALQARQEVEALLRSYARRESEFAHELLQAHREAEQTASAQALAHMEQEQELRREQAEREQALTRQAEQLRQEAAEAIRSLARWENEFARELLQTHREAEHASAEQARTYMEQERALRHEQAEREQALTQQIDQLRLEAEELLRSLSQRESEFARELLQTHRETEQKATEQARRHAEHEHALHQDYSARQQTLIEQLLASQEGLRNAEERSHERERQLGQELAGKQEKLVKLIQAHDTLEAQLREQIAAQQQATQLLQTSLDTIHASLMWRLTSPIRAIINIFASSPTEKAQTPITATGAPIIAAPAMEHAPITPEIQVTSNIPNTYPLREPNMSAPQSINQIIIQRNGKYQAKDLLALNDQKFIEQAYLVILNRAPDAEGLNYYLNRVRHGYSKIGILTQMLSSAEAESIACQIEGLNIPAKLLKLAGIPILGSLLALFGIETNSITQRQLRRIESQVYVLSQQTHQNFQHFEQIFSVISNQIGCIGTNKNRKPNNANSLATTTSRPEIMLQPAPEAVKEWVEILNKD